MLTRRTFARLHTWLLLTLISSVCLAGALVISLAVELPADNEFNFARWEMRHLPGKWLYLTGQFFRGDLSGSEEDQRMGRFLVVSARVRLLERTFSADDAAQRKELALLLSERDDLENDVEAIVEGRLTKLLEEAGLESSLPFFPDARWVFPPVDVEFDEPPRVLAVSPRERIELIEQRPLRAGLALQDVVQVEEAVEEDGGRSALVEGRAGVAAYPSIVAPRGEYQQLVGTIAHEWVHHYLTFKPLGSRYFSGVELQTLNETVADLVGDELGALIVQRYPLLEDVESELAELAGEGTSIDVGDVLRRLRLDVERLLAGGEIEAAEALMEERRRELADEGVLFRRINQAFFASRSLYANTPASIDPIGGKVQALRERSGSVGAFLQAAAQLTSEADLDRVLEESTSTRP